MPSHDASPVTKTSGCDVIIVGAGPVGLLLGNLLGQAGLHVVILEKRTGPLAQSAAIGITPPSLHILSKLGLEHAFMDRGVKVRDCIIHGESGRLGSVTFRDIPDKFRWILSLPQTGTMALLQQNLAEFPNVKLHSGVEVIGVKSCADRAVVEFVSQNSDAAPVRWSARWVVACDGARSSVREHLGIDAPGRTYPCHFIMGDFVERTSLGDEAHLFFMADGAVESFPLPNGLRRWIVQTSEFMHPAPPNYISEIVKRRTGIVLSPDDQTNDSAFTPRRYDCSRYHQGKVILCGDAAHGMSPIGGQGMNTGFADAEFLAGILPAIIQRGEAALPLLEAYERFRRKAARTASSRAEWGMWFGTWRGRLRSRLRDFVIRDILCRWPIARRMGSLYAMLTIPFNRLECVPLGIRPTNQLGVHRYGVFSADKPVHSNPSPTHAD
jgi:2-polyprenyl-6-methoxyphenol hydroxylase-like FAD-dependent oxidoreductase